MNTMGIAFVCMAANPLQNTKHVVVLFNMYSLLHKPLCLKFEAAKIF